MDDESIPDTRADDWRQLAVCRESLLDLDVVVDDARAELDAALHTFRAAVTARDATAQRLADLVRRMAA